MPVSPWRNIGSVVELIVAANPRTALDIGVGNGKWGYLVREYIDVWQGRHHRTDWQVRIEGVEVYAPYIHDYQRLIYDEIHIGRAQDVVPKLDRSFDLILACDVIEHFTKPEALAMITLLRSKTNRALVLSIPVGPGWLRNSYNENPYEAHLSEWSPAEFHALGAEWIQVSKIQDDRRDTALVCFPGSEWRATPPPIPHGFFPLRTRFHDSAPLVGDLAAFTRQLSDLLATDSIAQIEWADSSSVAVNLHDIIQGNTLRAQDMAQTTCLPFPEASFETAFNLGTINKVDDLSLSTCLSELHRVIRTNLWVALQTTPNRDGAWWQRQFSSAGFHRHPLNDQLNLDANQENDQTSFVLLLSTTRGSSPFA